MLKRKNGESPGSAVASAPGLVLHLIFGCDEFERFYKMGNYGVEFLSNLQNPVHCRIK